MYYIIAIILKCLSEVFVGSSMWNLTQHAGTDRFRSMRNGKQATQMLCCVCFTQNNIYPEGSKRVQIEFAINDTSVSKTSQSEGNKIQKTTQYTNLSFY